MKRILLIEDNLEMRENTAEILELAGYEVITAENGKDGVRLAKEHTSDLILCDVMMPEMDGMELIRHLGELHYQGGIIIVSEMDHKVISLAANLAKQHNAHLIGNISKPVQLSQVSRLLTKVAQLNSHTLLKEPAISKDELIDALKNDEITPFYQPKINADNNKIESVEVLARILSSKDDNIILPCRFINTAEQHNLINQITFSLFDTPTVSIKFLIEAGV